MDAWNNLGQDGSARCWMKLRREGRWQDIERKNCAKKDEIGGFSSNNPLQRDNKY
jgi:hypothetical protein